MKRVGCLFEQVSSWQNLLLAARQATSGKKGNPEVARFLFHLEPELLELEQQLKSGAWRPGLPYTFHIRDPKPRVISAAPLLDRVVHHAIMNVLDPHFERALISHTYACRKGKGAHAAVKYAQRLARRYPYFLKADIDRYFETVDQTLLKNLLRRMLKDSKLLTLMDRIIDFTGGEAESRRSLPIGNLTSQYFANHLLGQLDRFIKHHLQVKGYLRYMDDFLCFGSSRAALHTRRADIRRYLADALHLRLKEGATFVAPTHRGVPFLGFRIFPGTIRLEGVRWRRMRRKIRRRERAFLEGSMSSEELAISVRSTIAHIEHAQTLHLRRRFFYDSFDLG